MTGKVTDTNTGAWWVTSLSPDYKEDMTDEQIKARFEELFGEPCAEVQRETTSNAINIYAGPISQEKIDRRRKLPDVAS